jgi:hypothetical protein
MRRGGSIVRLAACLAVAASVGAAATPAGAADPGRWTLTGKSTIPLEYYQGVASGGSSLFFNGIHLGLYRTDASLHENGRADDVIPPQVTASEGYNHIGDIAFDAREGGRVLLPMECYYPEAAPGQSDPNNTCRTGSIAVADPQTLQWRYYVKLDPAEIPKVMWVAMSPDGELIWTQSGDDLLAYRADDVNPANAVPGGPLIHPVRRLVGAKPPSGITGAVFYQGRMYVAGQEDAMGFQVWSIDVATGERRLEIERAVIGESEGLDVFDALGGVLHWIVAPYNTENLPSEGPFYTSTLLHFVPQGEATAGAPSSPAGSAGAVPRIRLTASPRRTLAGRRVRFGFRATATIAGRRRPVGRAVVRFAGRRALTDRTGRARITRFLPRAGGYRARATRRDLRPGSTMVRATRRQAAARSPRLTG